MYASGRALVYEARERPGQSPQAGTAVATLAGSAQALDGRAVTAAAAQGDPAARSICTAVGRWLGHGLANLATALDPALFVIGGGVSAAGELLLGPAREQFASTLAGRGFRPDAVITVAALGPDAGLVGAADLARGQLAS
jgi:glucokinase